MFSNFRCVVFTIVVNLCLLTRLGGIQAENSLKYIPFQNYDYGEVLGLSLLFYEAQRSGKLPEDNRIPWRGDSMLTDVGQNGEDLTGGYFDAGDHVKFGYPMAASATVLGWGLIDFEEAYEVSGQLENARKAIRWFAEYFIKAHPSPNELYVQVGDGVLDHAYWGRPEDWVGPRPSFKITQDKPGSDAASETAAALAAASIIFRNSDPALAQTALQHARELYDFADTYRGRYNDSIPEAGPFYGSWAYGDELAWGAAWMFRATNEEKYRNDFQRHWTEFYLTWRPYSFGWDDKLAGVHILAAKIFGDAEYVTAATSFCDWLVDEAPKTPKGLVFLSEWGSLRSAGSVSFVCLQLANAGVNPSKYINFAQSQINYALGDTGRSYVCGYGNNPPVRPHHRGSSCPDKPLPCNADNAANNPGPNYQVLYGALVGGPDAQDQYEDDRLDYVKNEVACDYNAGFQSALAGLLHFQLTGSP